MTNSVSSSGRSGGEPTHHTGAERTGRQPVQDLVRRFNLLPHPEGGYYRETYRSTEAVQRLEPETARSASTAIYYLLDGGAYSAWHRIASDELWHFYAGDPLLVHILEDGGRIVTHRLGNALQLADGVFQALVPKGRWFAAEPTQPDGFSFVGCTVAPGFEFSEFELARAEDLQPWAGRNPALVQRLLKQAGVTK